MRNQYKNIFTYKHGGPSTFHRCKKIIHDHVTLLLVILAAVIVSLTLYLGGVITLLAEKDFENFSYRLEVPNFRNLILKLDQYYSDPLQRGGSKETLNYQSLLVALKRIPFSNESVSKIVPLTQFENLDYSIDTKISCTSQWDAIDSSSIEQLQNKYKLISVIIVVKSAANNYARRQAIRDTWFTTKSNSLFMFKTAFMVGACDKQNPPPKSISGQLDSTWTPDDCRRSIKNESIKHGDLIQSTGVDSYYNNTIKTVMTLRWVSTRCPSDYFLSLDDDFVFEEENLEQFLKDLALQHSGRQVITKEQSKSIPNSEWILALRNLTQTNLYIGHVRDYVHPHRHLLSKWYIACEDYPYNKYPRFVTGGAILMSHMTVRQFAIASYFTQTFIFDDVYLGIMARKLEIDPVHEANFVCVLEDYLATNPYHSGATNCIGVHDIDPDQLVKFWADIRGMSSIKPNI